MSGTYELDPSLSCGRSILAKHGSNSLQGFDPNVGLFASTSDNRLYPNPEAPALVPEALQLFEFMGRMLGKVCICTGLQHAA